MPVTLICRLHVGSGVFPIQLPLKVAETVDEAVAFVERVNAKRLIDDNIVTIYGCLGEFFRPLDTERYDNITMFQSFDALIEHQLWLSTKHYVDAAAIFRVNIERLDAGFEMHVKIGRERIPLKRDHQVRQLEIEEKRIKREVDRFTGFANLFTPDVPNDFTTFARDLVESAVVRRRASVERSLNNPIRGVKRRVIGDNT